MAYQLPKCECGQLLQYFEVRFVEFHRNINKTGTLSKAMQTDGGVSESEGLHCNKCQITFQVDYDKKSRIIRGEPSNNSEFEA